MRAALALLLILAVGRTAAAEPERVGLVVSGGISLGSYQAGVLYARIKDLRARRAEAGLELVTGASAGSINAWLTVVGWCDDRPERMAFFANPFFDIWTNVGLDALLPLTDDGATYARLVGETLGSARVVRIGRDLAAAPEPPDPWAAGEHPQGLLTRNAFGVVGRYLAERLADTGYRDGCRVRTAVTLTGAEAVELPLAAGDATVRTLRFVVPLTAEVTGGRLAVRNDGVDVAAGDASCWDPAAPDGRHPWEACHPSIGRTLGLPVGAGGVPGRAVVGLVQAASAFPVAFSPVPLATCASRGAAEAPGPGCTDGLAAHAGRFIDGGFFDNVPLGPAVEIAHDEDLRWRGQGRVPDLTLHYVDPEQRRGAARLPENRRRPDGLGAFTRLAGGLPRGAVDGAAGAGAALPGRALPGKPECFRRLRSTATLRTRDGPAGRAAVRPLVALPWHHGPAGRQLRGLPPSRLPGARLPGGRLRRQPHRQPRAPGLPRGRDARGVSGRELPGPGGAAARRLRPAAARGRRPAAAAVAGRPPGDAGGRAPLPVPALRPRAPAARSGRRRGALCADERGGRRGGVRRGPPRPGPAEPGVGAALRLHGSGRPAARRGADQ
ncbi:MAG: patatin-like phospholipase family protein [bacterium]